MVCFCFVLLITSVLLYSELVKQVTKLIVKLSTFDLLFSVSAL